MEDKEAVLLELYDKLNEFMDVVSNNFKVVSGALKAYKTEIEQLNARVSELEKTNGGF
jgi:archaellum component FlaC